MNPKLEDEIKLIIKYNEENIAGEDYKAIKDFIEGKIQAYKTVLEMMHE